MTKHPTTQWSKFWANLHTASEELKAAWFMVNHDLIPTNDRPAKIQRSTTNNCHHCGRVDTLICAGIWRWTRSRIAIILRMDPKYISPKWTVRPSLHFWPPQRHGAILWILAHMIYCRTQHWHRVSTVHYADFMRCVRWKEYQATRRREKFGNYLVI